MWVLISHPDYFHQSVPDCKNGPTNFPLVDAIDVRDIDEGRFADSTLFSGTNDDVNDLGVMREEPVDVEKSADSVRVFDDVRRADEHVKRIAEVCVDAVGRCK